MHHIEISGRCPNADTVIQKQAESTAGEASTEGVVKAGHIVYAHQEKIIDCEQFTIICKLAHFPDAKTYAKVVTSILDANFDDLKSFYDVQSATQKGDVKPALDLLPKLRSTVTFRFKISYGGIGCQRRRLGIDICIPPLLSSYLNVISCLILIIQAYATVHFEPMSSDWDARQGMRVALPPQGNSLEKYICALPGRHDGLLDLQHLLQDRLDEKTFLQVVTGFDPVSTELLNGGLSLFHNLTSASMRPPSGDLASWYRKALRSKDHFSLTEAVVCHVLDVEERSLIYHWDVTSDLTRRMNMKKKVPDDWTGLGIGGEGGSHESHYQPELKVSQIRFSSFIYRMAHKTLLSRTLKKHVHSVCSLGEMMLRHTSPYHWMDWVMDGYRMLPILHPFVHISLIQE